MTVTYQGEHLLWGNIGHLAVVLAFAAALLATFCYYKSANDDDPDRISWFKTARLAWMIHSVSVFMIIVSLFAIIYNHSFEYYYAWRHSSTELPVRVRPSASAVKVCSAPPAMPSGTTATVQAKTVIAGMR